MVWFIKSLEPVGNRQLKPNEHIVALQNRSCQIQHAWNNLKILKRLGSAYFTVAANDDYADDVTGAEVQMAPKISYAVNTNITVTGVIAFYPLILVYETRMVQNVVTSFFSNNRC